MAELGDAVGDHLIEEGLYHASPTSLLQRLSAVEEHTSRVLVIAHMPTVRMLAEGLIGRAAADRVGGLPFAPGAVAVLDVDVSWAAIDGGVASLAAFHS